jgi:uncharacterized membrane protein YphA (DoxX/SURF4 family)
VTAIIERVDHWCRSGPFTAPDLAKFRIMYAIAILLWFPPVAGLTTYPADSFHPQVGPMLLFSQLPSREVLDALGYATTVCAALLLVGMWTRFATLIVSLCLMVSYGLINSFGKIDHPHLLFWIPAVMLFSDWGRGLTPEPAKHDDEPIAQWPLRLLALIIGLSFMTSGYAKLRAGWLDVHTHATQGYLLRNYVLNDRRDWLAPELVSVTSGAFWEALDWATVFLELGLVFAALSWLVFRIALALATQFHLAVMLVLNIPFVPNVLAYGAFVSWHRVAPSVPLRVRWNGTAALCCALVIGVGAYQAAIHRLSVNAIVIPATIWLGAVIGAGYLAALLIGQVRRLRVRGGTWTPMPVTGH